MTQENDESVEQDYTAEVLRTGKTKVWSIQDYVFYSADEVFEKISEGLGHRAQSTSLAVLRSMWETSKPGQIMTLTVFVIALIIECRYETYEEWSAHRPVADNKGEKDE